MHIWGPPSDQVAELIRIGTSRMLEDSTRLLDEVDRVAIEAADPIVQIEPRLVDVIRASSRANFAHWAQSNSRAPGMPVRPNLSAETVDLARDVIRYGFDEAIMRTFHSAQPVAIKIWTDVAFELTDDPALLHELLQVVTRSVFAFVDDTVAALYELINRERSQLTDATHVARMETVSLILEGSPISSRRASDRLRYELDRRHIAAILWSDHNEIDAGLIEQVADAIARSSGALRPLRLLVSSSTMWVWVPTIAEPDLAVVRAALKSSPGVRLAIGRADSGMAGFRRSHLDAVVTQRLMRRLPASTQLSTYDDVEVVALATQNQERAAEFVTRTLGDLATAPDELRETVRVYLREGSSPTHAARAMYTHRNTVLSRLDRARALLPTPLDGRGLQIALALEIAHVFAD
ncbi:PucR family transcriptional regulator [Smaragdicoccus niigatensis]|uniref:PucR family transcriptional regulator n=1 Tax=Smaragdicoccus niigatensis TaxID=359359 RepID=UPI00036CA298|nr:helix-turn-helix domain-containing protein [Smaragdicoccus niigatensis]